MKVVIWIVCAVAVASLTVCLKEAGIILGAIPTALLYAGMVALAGFLCKLWDKHQAKKYAKEQRKKNQ